MSTARKVIYCFCICCITISVSWGQDQIVQKLIQGKKYFWEAKFENSMTYLKQVVESNTKNKEYLFEAYLYMGFVLTRQDAHFSKVKSAFEQAIKVDPRRKLDELIIPPDLAERFNNIRNQLVGCLYVTTEPLDTEIMGVQGDSITFIERTPALICDLATKQLQILFTKRGFEEHIRSVQLKVGSVDTLFVTLNPTFPQKSHGTKLWSWVARGGIVISAAAVLYKTVIQSGGDETEKLPGPPSRPTP
ncbi:MAG: hypothetical protein ACE5NG_09570 [bacterium]